MQITEQEIKDAFYHLEVLNEEHGQIRDDVAKLKEGFFQFKAEVIGIKTDLAWLKKFFWIVISASVGSVIVQVAQMITK